MRSLLLLLVVAACTPDHPFDKPGTWHLSDGYSANDVNLRAMIVNPNDLIEGTGTKTALGSEASPPVRKLLTGHRAQLPLSNVSAIGGAQPQQQQQPVDGGNNAGE